MLQLYGFFPFAVVFSHAESCIRTTTLRSACVCNSACFSSQQSWGKWETELYSFIPDKKLSISIEI